MDGLRLLLTDDADEARAPGAAARDAQRRAAGDRPADPRRGDRAGRGDRRASSDGRRHRARGRRLACRRHRHRGVPAGRALRAPGVHDRLRRGAPTIGKGSGRSISRFDLHDALAACGDLLERFGGHRMAAGLTVRRDRFDEFRERFVAEANRQLAPRRPGARAAGGSRAAAATK